MMLAPTHIRRLVSGAIIESDLFLFVFVYAKTRLQIFHIRY